MSEQPNSCCVICAEPNYATLFRSRAPEDHGDIVRCERCTHTYVVPMPSNAQITAYYKGLYAEKANHLSEQQMALAEQSMAGYLSVLNKLGAGKVGASFLDLGGGLGYYAAAAQKRGLRATLVDLDPCSVAFVQKHHQLTDVVLGTTEEFASTSTQQFDVVFLRHVVEHYTDPRTLIECAKNLLSPDGLVIIETDNGESVEMLVHPGTRRWYIDHYRSRFHDVSFRSLWRKRPFAVDPPRHLHGFSSRNLIRLLESNGLEARKAFSYRLGDPIYWPNIPDVTLRNCLSSVARLHPKEAIHRICDFGFRPVRRYLARTGRAAGLCIYAGHS